MNSRAKILLVDDDASFVESNKELLEAYDYEVFIAYDGSSGLEIAKNVKPDLMILDVMMAGKPEGFEIARKIPKTEELQNMKVLLVTGFAKEMKLTKKLEPDEEWLPVDRVMEKPINPGRFINEIEKLLQSPTKIRYNATF